jgi:hypothetical protein
MKPKLASNSWYSCLILFRAGITSIYLHTLFGNSFLISFSDFSLLEYRNTMFFFHNRFSILQFCWMCLWLLMTLCIFIYKIMSSTNGHNTTYSFPIWMSSIIFPLFSLSRTSNTILKRSCNNRLTLFVPNHREKAFSFSS